MSRKLQLLDKLEKKMQQCQDRWAYLLKRKMRVLSVGRWK